jgi:hypothetical protein
MNGAEEAVRFRDRIVNADPIRIGGASSANASTCRADRRAHACVSRARKRKHRTVTLRFYDRAAVISRDVADDRSWRRRTSRHVVAKARGETVESICL